MLPTPPATIPLDEIATCLLSTSLKQLGPTEVHMDDEGFQLTLTSRSIVEINSQHHFGL
jgi:hypothetical protein